MSEIKIEDMSKNIEYKGRLGKREKGFWTITDEHLIYKNKKNFKFIINNKEIIEIQKSVAKNSLIIIHKLNSINVIKKTALIIDVNFDVFLKEMSEIIGKEKIKEVDIKAQYLTVFCICAYLLAIIIISLLYYL